MLYGPDQIIACPHCRALVKYETLLSGNTFRRQLWTDGKSVSPMLPKPPPFVICHACRRGYWLADAREVGHVPNKWRPDSEADEVDPRWRAAPYVEEPAEADYYAALASERFEFDPLLWLRILAFQRRNDGLRDARTVDDTTPDPGGAEAIASGASRDNLIALRILMAAEAPPNVAKMMRGEVLRALGEFAQAEAVYDRLTTSHLRYSAAKLATLSRLGIAGVRLMPYE